MRDDLALIVEAAREAGLIAMRYFRNDPQVWWKEGNSPVSEADYAVDRYLRETLLGARPDYGWVSEEMTPEDAGAQNTDRFFVVDPIDGTRAFLRGEDTWCVAIAIIENGRPVAGAIEVPALSERFEALAGGDALMNGKLLRANGAHESALAVALPDTLLRRFEDTVPSAEQAELSLEPCVPTLAYRLALVASGRLDGTLIRARANDWDVAAADLILERAGGRLVDLDGEIQLYSRKFRRHGVLLGATDPAVARLSQLAHKMGC